MIFHIVSACVQTTFLVLGILYFPTLLPRLKLKGLVDEICFTKEYKYPELRTLCPWKG